MKSVEPVYRVDRPACQSRVPAAVTIMKTTRAPWLNEDPVVRPCAAIRKTTPTIRAQAVRQMARIGDGALPAGPRQTEREIFITTSRTTTKFKMLRAMAICTPTVS